jgi:adenylate kinase
MELVIREDDREDVVRERLAQYERQTQPLIEFFRAGGHRLYQVDASTGSPDEVFRQVQTKLADLVQVG